MSKRPDDEDGPERTCIVTRRKGDPAAMIRFVLGPDAIVVPDIRRKLPGRGVWIGGHESLVAQAARKGAFARGFKTKVTVPAALAAETEALLARDCLQALSMANKAGVVVAGFAKVEAALAGGAVAALLHASEAGEDGVRKIDGLARRHGSTAGPPAAVQPTSVKLFSSLQLDLALGRTNVIHAALATGPVSAAFLARCQRLRVYRSEAPPEVDAVAEAGSA